MNDRRAQRSHLAVEGDVLLPRFGDIRAVRHALTTHNKPATAATIAGRFSKSNKSTVAELLETLVAVGQARVTAGGEYAP